MPAEGRWILLCTLPLAMQLHSVAICLLIFHVYPPFDQLNDTLYPIRWSVVEPPIQLQAQPATPAFFIPSHAATCHLRFHPPQSMLIVYCLPPCSA